MARAFLLVLDSVGCGGAPDAAEFGDEGANTLGHIIQACARGEADEGRSGTLHVPNLDALGLGAAVRLATGIETPGLDASPAAGWGAATEVSQGKDTPSGHWELAGLPVPWDWHYFPNTRPAFDDDLVAEIIERGKIPGILGNRHAPGIPIIEDLGAESYASGKPICYTSVDSVFQIAAHETAFGLDRLYDLCRGCAQILHPMKVGRVIARPFVGTPEEGFTRTKNRKDFAITPPEPTLCNWVEQSGHSVWGIGKIGDIFAGSGITHSEKGGSDDEHFGMLLDHLGKAGDGDLVFANFVDFDTLYGHPRDVAGYATNLEAFDRRLPELTRSLKKGDLAIITADHGNDPTWTGTDHTRERVPVLAFGPDCPRTELGICGFVDVAATIAAHLDLPDAPRGRNLL